MTSSVLELSIAQARSLLMNRQVSSSELVKTCIARIASTEPTYHAFSTVGAASALSQACALDSEAAHGRFHGPLHGIPIAVKDMILTKDLPTTAGSRVPLNLDHTRDAATVRMMREAGAIIIGKTVTHEFAYGTNRPETRNAWDYRRYPGGSSCGSSVATALRSAFGALGTDTGGSVRVPASVNGVVGLKPTRDLVSREGVLPMSALMDTVGVMARSAADCRLLLNACMDPSSRVDDETNRRRGQDTPLRGITLGLCESMFFGHEQDPEIIEAVISALATLRTLGAQTTAAEVPLLGVAAWAGSLIVLAETSNWHRSLLRTHADKYEPGTRVMLQAGELLPTGAYTEALLSGRVIAGKIEEALEAHSLDALVLPTLPTDPPFFEDYETPLTADSSRFAYDVHHLMFANLAGLPAITLPCGVSPSGIPIGMQLVGRRNFDGLLLSIGEIFQDVTSWHTLAPPSVRAVAN